MARNWQFPKVGTHGCQRGTTGYYCKELPVPRGWNSWLPTWEPWVTIASNCRFQKIDPIVPNLGTIGYHCKELLVPKGWNWWLPAWEPQVTMARNCRFPDVETYCSQQKSELMFSKLSRYHWKELRVPKAWNSWFQTWMSIRYQRKYLLIPKS